MSRSAKYEFNGSSFRTKKQIEQHMRAILERTEVGSELQGDDLAFVEALLQHHHRAKQKLGAGIAAIRVDLNTEWKAWKMLTLVRCDGSETDFSYRACIYPRNKLQEFQEACRQAVVPDILEFKRQYYADHADEFNQIRCPVTNQIVGWDESHIDHDLPWPFREIVKAYCIERGAQIETIDLDGDEDGACQYQFRDAAIRDDFREFHGQRAQLRVLSKEANLRTKRSPQSAKG